MSPEEAVIADLRGACRAAVEAARHGQADDATRHLAAASDHTERLGTDLAHGLLLLAAGKVAGAEGRTQQAVDQTARAVSLLPPGADLADACSSLGVARLMAGQTDEAEQALETAARQHAELGQELDLARCRANLALVLKARGRYRAALGMLDAVAAVLAREGEPNELARVELNRASLLTELGRYEPALAAARAAAARFDELDERLEAARARWAEANAACGLSLFPESLVGYRLAADELERAGLVAEAAAIRVNMGEVYRRMGDPELALQALRDAAGPLAVSPPAHRATLALNRAAVLAGLARYADALAALAEAEAIYGQLDLRVEGADARLLRARVQVARGERAQAAVALDEARAVLAVDGAPHLAALADLHRADLHLAEGELVEAETTYWSVLGSLPEGLADLRWRARRGLALVAERAGDDRTALEHGLAAVAELDALAGELRHDLLRRGFDEAPDHGELFGAVLAICARRGDAATALEVMQQAKARGLVEAVRAAEVPLVDAPEAWLAAERGVAVRVNELLATASAREADPSTYEAWTRELTAAREELLELHLELARAAPDQAALRGLAGTSPQPDELRHVLDEGTLLVETFTAGDDLFLLALGAEALSLIHRPGAMRAVGELLDNYAANLDLLAGVPPELLGRVVAGLHVAAEADAQELYRLLFEPLADLLDGAVRVIVAPHGRLGAVPFAALHDGLDPLVESLELALVPSATVLHRLATRPARGGRGSLAVQGATDSLTAAARELELVRGLVDRCLVAGEATRESVLEALAEPALVHYSGHADFRPESSLFSALRLANGERVTAADLYRRHIKADLVTLAACDTGRHDRRSRQELMGLARAFLHAGAGTVLAALWRAPDEATLRLMAAFYEARRAGARPAAALRAAQREVRAATLHPFYWAGFTPIGLA